MKKAVCILLSCIILIALTACGDDGSLIGTWAVAGGETNSEFTFNEDGTGKFGINGYTVDMVWSVDDKGLLTVKAVTADTEYDAITEAEFSIKGNMLTIISDGEQIVLKRK